MLADVTSTAVCVYVLRAEAGSALIHLLSFGVRAIYPSERCLMLISMMMVMLIK